jgi:hypothetical protein
MKWKRIFKLLSPWKLTSITNGDTLSENQFIDFHWVENWPYENHPWYLNVKKMKTFLGIKTYPILIFNNKGLF